MNKVNTIEEYLDSILAKAEGEPKQSSTVEIKYVLKCIAKMQNPIVGKENAIRRFNILTKHIFDNYCEVKDVNKTVYPTEYIISAERECNYDLLYDVLDTAFKDTNLATQFLFDDCKLVKEEGFHVNVGGVKIPFKYDKVMIKFKTNSSKIQIEMIPILKSNISIYDIRHKNESIIHALNLAASSLLQTVKDKTIDGYLIIYNHEIN